MKYTICLMICKHIKLEHEIWYDMIWVWEYEKWKFGYTWEYENMKIQEKKIWKVRTGDMSARIWKNAEYSNFSPQPHNEKCHAQTKIYLLKNSNKGDLAKDLNISWISQLLFLWLSASCFWGGT